MLTPRLELTWAVVIVDDTVEETGGGKGGGAVAVVGGGKVSGIAVVAVGLRQLL